VLTADTAFQFGTYCATTLNSHLNKLTYTVLVEYLEGVYLQDLLLQVYGEE
jgi:hypothetical protein